MVHAFINQAKAKLRNGQAICGFGITMAAPALAQIIAQSGADFLNVDLEHGVIDLAAAHAIIAATAGTNCTPLVRVRTAKSSQIKPILDAGAMGVIFPMVRARAEIEAGIAAALYPPAGKRGIGPHYAPARWGMSVDEYVNSANDAMLNVALIETREAVDCIDDIVTVPGLDVATIAVADLAASLGFRQQPGHPAVAEAVLKIEKAVFRAGIALGGVASSPEDARHKRKAGYRVLVLGFDVNIIGAAISQWIAVLSS